MRERCASSCEEEQRRVSYFGRFAARNSKERKAKKLSREPRTLRFELREKQERISYFGRYAARDSKERKAKKLSQEPRALRFELREKQKRIPYFGRYAARDSKEQKAKNCHESRERCASCGEKKLFHAARITQLETALSLFGSRT